MFLLRYFYMNKSHTLINQLMTLNTRFQESFMTGKNHPTLKNLWRSLVAAMEWAELDECELKCIDETRWQFRFST